MRVGAGIHDPTVGEGEDAVGHIGEDGVVRDDDGERAEVAVDALDRLQDGDAGVDVEGPGGLVAQENLGTLGDRARDRDALLLATRKLRREVVQAVGEIDHRERLLGRHRVAADFRDERHVLPGGQARDQVVGLENKAHRGMAVLDPVKLVLSNWAEAFGSDSYLEDCSQPALPHSAIAEGQTPPADRTFKIGKEVWIEREDFEEVPPKGYKRLSPPQTTPDGVTSAGAVVRLKGGYVIECTGFAKDAQGVVTEVHAKVFPETKSGTAGSDSVKAKGVITWVGVADGVKAEVRLYDRLFSDPQPDAGGKDFLEALNPHSLKVVQAIVEPSLRKAMPNDKFQFERLGYFVADRVDHSATHLVFNRAVGLKDSWGK